MVLSLLCIVFGLLTLLALKESGQYRQLYAACAIITFLVTGFFLFEHLQDEKRLRALPPSPPQFAFQANQADESLTPDGDTFSYEDLEAIAVELARQLKESEGHIQHLHQRLEAKRQFILENWEDKATPNFLHH
ncbi:hypothetical protein PTW35_17920 (plasmid) [Photobacterium sp. DA100]|uniref:hypothetical protein n=1 Tax=Photobacterium sp. DA100 TaxID=3027472 RepID=UPI00247AC849|nr:hypothetical protein [Photobacterium sp. DA100]WEM44981.1 hypothetical protein PTW35_17920 [Photobacterium sp. DA100]